MANFWTMAREMRLRVLWAEGHSSSKIAAMFKAELSEGERITRSMVCGKVNRMKLPPRDSKVCNNPAHRSQKRRRNAAPKPTAPAPDQSPVSLEGAQSHHCRFPVGEGPDFHFCGAPKRQGSPYCEHHHAIAYTPAPKVRKRKKAPAPRIGFFNTWRGQHAA